MEFKNCLNDSEQREEIMTETIWLWWHVVGPNHDFPLENTLTYTQNSHTTVFPWNRVNLWFEFKTKVSHISLLK